MINTYQITLVLVHLTVINQ